ncbi:MAG: dynamin family protein [Bacteroidaceae bacterium]|nr:dynamin family protein [Bacteroidaceae bacterium]
MPIQVLTNKCDNVKNAVVAINDEYATQLETLPDIKKQLKKVLNRASEYENGSFIVLVVGPVKSGKSTLVNLIADAYVSPTHFLECTVRPSIISKQKEGEENLITSFSSGDTMNKVEHIDSIIDCIRGLESEASLTGMNINIDKVPLTEENIKEKVELGLQESLTAETLVTSITTPGGQLLQDNVFVMDMPGFDGKYANIDDPVYETIAQRADLIIFVQSSNSAISKVSKDFLDVLKENNKNVPVCLVHNFFEAAHWHSEEEKQKNNAEQKQFAINEIKALGFNIDEEHCFCINLGKVKDARARNEQGEYLYADVREQILQPEADKYTEMEKELYKRVVSHRDEMQLQNCLNRTKQQLEKLEKRLKEELEERQKKIDEYKRVEDDFKKMSISESFKVKFELPENIRSIVSDTICNAVDTKIEGIHQDNRFTRSEAITKVKELIVYCGEELYKMYATKLAFGTVENSLYNACLERKNSILELIAEYNLPFVSCMTKLKLSELPKFSLENCADVTAVVPPIPIGTDDDWHLRRHKKGHIKVYFDTVKDRLIGTTSPTVVNSYIQEEIEPIILKHLEDNIGEIETSYLSRLHEINDYYRTQLLKALIPEGFEIFVQVTGKLNVLLETMQKIIGTINFNRRDEA